MFFPFHFCVLQVLYSVFLLWVYPPIPQIRVAFFGVFTVYFTVFYSQTLPPLPCLSAPPHLSPTEMRRGQGIWGEEHREAALHNLKGILMKQHSRTAYSHDNRPQTNSCIWSPFVLWLWKRCVCVRERVWLFLFLGYVACQRVHESQPSHPPPYNKLAWDLIDFNVCTRQHNYCLTRYTVFF